MATQKINRADLIEKVLQIVRSKTSNPADELIAEGKVMQAIGEALKGCPAAEARVIIETAAKLLEVA